MSLFRFPAQAVFGAALLAVAAGCAPAAPSGPPVAAWGDSLTLGFPLSADQSYPAAAEQLFAPPRPVANHGIGGQTSTEIAARLGALPVTASVEGDAIPASGAVTLISLGIDAVHDTAAHSATLEAELCGVRGTLTQDHRFERAAAGAIAPCAPGSILKPVLDAATRDGTVWLWMGRNGADRGRTIEADIAATVAAIGPSRTFVGAILTGANDGPRIAAIRAMNDRLKATYGPHFVDVLGALLAAGDGSAEDASDIARFVPPRSLRTDDVHLTAKGNAIVAAAFVTATLALEK